MIHPASAGEEHKESRSSGIEIFHQELERRMEEMGIDLPSGISVEYFTYHVLLGEDEAGVLDPTFLTEVLADLQQPGHIVSWYWEEAFSSILLLYSFLKRLFN